MYPDHIARSPYLKILAVDFNKPRWQSEINIRTAFRMIVPARLDPILDECQ
jgi:hypothetical protein